MVDTPEGFEDTWSDEERAAHERAGGGLGDGDTPIPPGFRSRPDLYPQRVADQGEGQSPMQAYGGSSTSTDQG